MKTTIQKHSRRPSGAASQARIQATTNDASVKPQASPIDIAPLGSGRFGLFTRSMFRS